MQNSESKEGARGSHVTPWGRKWHWIRLTNFFRRAKKCRFLGPQKVYRMTCPPKILSLYLYIRNRWHRVINTGGCRCHCEQSGDSQRYSCRSRFVIQPKRHPRNTDNHEGGDINCYHIVWHLSLKLHVNWETRVHPCGCYNITLKQKIV